MAGEKGLTHRKRCVSPFSGLFGICFICLWQMYCSSLSEKMKKEIDSRKRRVGVGLVFLAMGGAGLASLGILLG